MWSGSIEEGFVKMRKRGALVSAVDPRELATATLCAVQGRLLLATRIRSGVPLKIAIDMAIDNIARRMRTG